jgi:uncharacterized protein (DUF433 family)
MDRISTDYPQLIGKGIYGVSEATRLTGVPSGCIRRWLNGYRYKTISGHRSAAPVFERELPLVDGELALSFLDLIEVRIVNSLRKQNFSWKLIRLAVHHAREVFKLEHPFATKSFKTDGRRIFADLRKSRGERPLIDLVDNQFAFRSLVEPNLRDLDFDSHQKAVRWWPLGARHRVLLDPQRNFGQPVVPEGVPTFVLWQASRHGESIETVAKWYKVETRAVKDAVEFERKLAA